MILTGSSVDVLAHGGGLDAYGGHHNRKLGGYHFHQGPLAGQSFATQADAIAALNAAGTPAPKATPTKATPTKVADQSLENRVANLEAMVAQLRRDVEELKAGR